MFKILVEYVDSNSLSLSLKSSGHQIAIRFLGRQLMKNTILVTFFLLVISLSAGAEHIQDSNQARPIDTSGGKCRCGGSTLDEERFFRSLNGISEELDVLIGHYEHGIDKEHFIAMAESLHRQGFVTDAELTAIKKVIFQPHKRSTFRRLFLEKLGVKTGKAG